MIDFDEKMDAIGRQLSRPALRTLSLARIFALASTELDPDRKKEDEDALFCLILDIDATQLEAARAEIGTALRRTNQALMTAREATPGKR